ncbi:MAG: hypothetical protein CMF96_06680 [Candidatus Marinimicrobia bacterium]|nr:hypothetical protein [Candidatus Neomarinimicrobiota bacterium]|tara:strand:- start:208 stop:1041 length:834 start_codon:yes stop_codon:yes gene_type:complete
MKYHFRKKYYLFSFLLLSVAFNEIIINEINYHSADNFNSHDWVEFYNPNSIEVNISNWKFKDELDDHIFTFPQNTIITSNGYLVLCRNDSAFTSNYPNITNFIGELEFGLSGGGEPIRLFNSNDILVDSVNYDDEMPWPSEPDGNGPTLELIHFSLDNSLAENWTYSSGNGTPGEINTSTLSTNENNNKLSNFEFINCFPNPFNNQIKISFSLPLKSFYTLKIFNIMGLEVASLINESLEPGSQSINWNAHNQPSGIYFVNLSYNGSNRMKKIILLK